MSITVSIKRRSLVIIALVAIALIAAGALWTSNRNKTLTQERAASIQNALAQNLIILDAGLGVDPSSPASAEEHRTISSSLKQNLEELERLSAQTDTNLSSQLQDIIEAEKLTLIAYDRKLAALKKAIEYNLADDIGSLSLASHKAEMLSRTVNTKKGLDAIRTAIAVKGTENTTDVTNKRTVEIDQQSNQLLNESINCFSNLEAIIQAAPDDQIIGTIQMCSESYGKTKESLNLDLVATLNNEAMKNQRKTAQALIKTLNPTSH